ncbi:MAG: tRNA adenosine(34) deaminase TadA [bacterium]
MRDPAADLQRDEFWMRHALQQAQLAQTRQEVPVGAVAVVGDTCISSAYNQTISSCDPSAHAEIVVLRDAARTLRNHRLPQVTLYVTLEPCMMCAGALIQARIARLVYGAKEPKAGAVDTHPLLRSEWLNHQLPVSGGVLADACGQIMSHFFADRRVPAAEPGRRRLLNDREYRKE